MDSIDTHGDVKKAAVCLWLLVVAQALSLIFVFAYGPRHSRGSQARGLCASSDVTGFGCGCRWGQS